MMRWVIIKFGSKYNLVAECMLNADPDHLVRVFFMIRPIQVDLQPYSIKEIVNV